MVVRAGACIKFTHLEIRIQLEANSLPLTLTLGIVYLQAGGVVVLEMVLELGQPSGIGAFSDGNSWKWTFFNLFPLSFLPKKDQRGPILHVLSIAS